MHPTPRSKLNSGLGVARIIVILAVLVIVMAVIIMIPGYRRYQRLGYSVACATALDSARRQLAADFMLSGWENDSAEGAQALVAHAMNGWDDLCPEGGTVYIVHNTGETVSTELEWDVICGLHGRDKKRCTRLNADYVLDQLREALNIEQNKGNPYPESLPFTLHGRQYTALLVDEETGLKRGTSTTEGYEGIVAFYSIAGHSDFGAGSGAKEGEIWYFSFADETHCAAWKKGDGWSGDSYRGIS